MPDFTRFGRSQRETDGRSGLSPLPMTMSVFSAMGLMITQRHR